MKNKQTSTDTPFFARLPVVVIGACISCLLWGCAFPCIKLGYRYSGVESSDIAGQIMYAGVRFTLAGLLAIIGGSLINRRILYPRPKAIPKVMLLSLFQTIIQYFFFYIGLAHTSGVSASIIEATNVFVAVLVAGLVFRMEHVTGRKIIGCIIGFVGVVIVNLNGIGLSAIKGMFSSWSILGEGFIFISTFGYAFSSVILKKFASDENPVMMSAYQFLFGGLVMLAAGAIMGGKLSFNTAGSILMVLYLAFISAAAYSLWGTLLKYNPVSRVAIFGFMNPVVGVILSAWLLDEADSIGLMSIVSLVLVCVGICIVNGQSRKKKNSEE